MGISSTGSGRPSPLGPVPVQPRTTCQGQPGAACPLGGRLRSCPWGAAPRCPACPAGVPISPEKWGERGPGPSVIGRQFRWNHCRVDPATVPTEPPTDNRGPGPLSPHFSGEMGTPAGQAGQRGAAPRGFETAPTTRRVRTTEDLAPRPHVRGRRAPVQPRRKKETPSLVGDQREDPQEESHALLLLFVCLPRESGAPGPVRGEGAYPRSRMTLM